ncbi:MAG TPA: tripartite tricarboxylate transporter substrate binding protein, partial [Usitatibacter sp.]|nr:tripartite tricarboxylate transporter substrate binding protein [Usitatibacter sp.]
VTTPNVIAVHPSVKANDLAQLIALARSRPGEMSLASGFQASSMHLAAERLQQLAGVRFNYIPYQGAVQAALAAASGHAEVVLAPLSDAAPHIASGRLRAIAVTSAERFALLKDVPTVAESGYPGFQAVQWFGAVAPAGTPKAAIARLSAEMQRALEDRQVRATFAKLGLVATPMGPEAFDQFIKGERVRLAASVREANVKVE